MAEMHPFRLSPDEVIQQALKFFGPDGIDLEIAVQEPERLRFEGKDGFIELEPRPDTNNQVRLLIQHKNYDQEIQAFRRVLSQQSAGQSQAQ